MLQRFVAVNERLGGARFPDLIFQIAARRGLPTLRPPLRLARGSAGNKTRQKSLFGMCMVCRLQESSACYGGVDGD